MCVRVCVCHVWDVSRVPGKTTLLKEKLKRRIIDPLASCHEVELEDLPVPLVVLVVGGGNGGAGWWW